jgi:hypothetical protein
MEWYRQVQFVAAVPMPPEMADKFGTTVNGMWTSPELGSADEVADLRARGRRALFSVPMIALVPNVYERPDRAVTPAHDVEVHVPWSGDSTSRTQIRPDGTRTLGSRIDGDHLVIEGPELDRYALVLIGEAPR